jgi:Domain of unknown function (DUF5667)
VNTTLLHRHRIERFAQLLDEADGARRHHTRSPLDDDLNDLVDVGTRLSDIHPQVEMRESARQDIRAMVMAMAERNGIGITARATADPAIGRARVGAIAEASTGRRPFARRVRARGAVLIGLAVGTLAVSGIAAASGTAMPGDALYGLKRSQESAQLQLSGSAASKGQLYLDFAGKRLGEAQSDIGNPNGLMQLIKQMDTETLQGVNLLFTDAVSNRDAAALHTVADFYARQKNGIAQLKAELPREQPQYELVLKYENDLNVVNLRWQQISAALSCPTIAREPADKWGPNVKTCGSAAGANGIVGADGTGTPNTGTSSTGTSSTGTSSTGASNTGRASGQPDANGETSTSTKVGAGAGSLVPGQTDGGVLNDIQRALGGMFH